MTEPTVSENAIVIERTFDAPVDQVWQLWTERQHLVNWYGPTGFKITIAEMDIRVGGKRLIRMEAPDGSWNVWMTGEFTELIPNERLVYTDSPSDEYGNLVPMGDSEEPFTTIVTVQLENLDGRTKMTMTHSGLPADEQGANEGWNQAFNKFETYLATII